ncbi:MAG: alpha/beta hydrolase [Spirochaetes bacterium]|nr:alpha/beta hydrolase [Spirochaetota bacterium]
MKHKKLTIAVAVVASLVLVAAVVLHNLTYTPHGRLDTRVALLLTLMKAVDIQLFKEGKTLAESRRTGDSSKLLRSNVDPAWKEIGESIQVKNGTIPLRIYIPRKAGTVPVVVYYHGGGWFMGSIDTHDGICRSLAKQADAVVVSVGYRLAPEHTFPAAAEDAYAGLLWVHENASSFGGDGSRMAVMGDSAGGNLAAAVTLMARDRKGPSLACQVLAYPVTNVGSTNSRSYEKFASGYYLTKRDMETFIALYVPDRNDRCDPRVSPLLARDVNGVPPAVVLTAEFDVLRDEGEAYAGRLERAGIPVFKHRFRGMVHGFLNMGGLLPQSGEAIAMAADRLKGAFREE